MKKIILGILLFIFAMVNLSFGGGWTWGDNTNDIYTKDKNEVIDDSDLDDPLRNGTKSAVQQVGGVINADTSTSEQRQKNIIKYVSKGINYFLGLLSLVMIIFIIANGIKIITAAGDDNKQKEAFKNVKNYIIALIGIGVSYLIINLIFHFVNYNTVV